MHNIRVFVHTPGRTTTTFAICGFRDALNFHFSDNAVIRPLANKLFVIILVNGEVGGAARDSPSEESELKVPSIPACPAC